MKVVHQDLIRLRAYEIWEMRGRPVGMEKQHWEQAERELLDAAPTLASAAPVASAARDQLVDAEAHAGGEPVASAGRQPARAEERRSR